jgi:lysozyme
MRQRAAAITVALGLFTACAPEGSAGPYGGGPYETLTQDLDICATGTVLQGADVSSYQGSIDWAQVAAAGLSFSIAKATEGLSVQDADFQANWTGMKANGVVRGAYHFFHSLDDGAAQADYFLAQVGTFQPGDLPPFLDWETTDTGDTTAHAITEAQNFINEIQARTGLTTYIYTYPSFWSGLGNPSQFGAYPLWMASYQTCPDIPAPWTSWVFQQNADTNAATGGDSDVFNGTLAQLQQVGVGGDGGVVITTPDGGSTLPATVLPQETGNDAVTLVNWTDEHVGIFAKTPSGTEEYSATTTTGDNWSTPLTTLDTGAECGSAAAFWGASYLYPELYSPLTAGGTGHLWSTAGSWNTYQSLGGTGLTHLSTVVWPSGLVEVFALGSGGAAWHDYFDTSSVSWVGWASLGGTSFSEGPRPLVWADGHGELYEVDSSGNVWRSTSATGSGTDWTAFAELGTGSNIASRLSPVRWPDGTVELFGRGTDGNVWRDTTTAGVFGGFTMLATQQTIGEPSAFMNPGGGAEVVARDSSGNVIDIAYSVASGSWPTSFTSLGEVSASDPFAWIRGDGNAEVFAVDGTGSLAHSLRTSGSWSTWGTIGTGLDSCAPAIVYVDGGMSSSSSGSVASSSSSSSSSSTSGSSSSSSSTSKSSSSSGSSSSSETSSSSGSSSSGEIADAGSPPPTPVASSGCSCSSGSADASLLCLFGALTLLQRRKRRG